MSFDLVIKNGTVVDGTGRPSFKASVGVKDGKIAAVLSQEEHDSMESGDAATIDAEGLVVAPGFIDMHSHSDFLLTMDDHPTLMTCLLEQGCTTIVGGNCGFSPAPLCPESKAEEHLAMACELMAGKSLDMKWGSMDSFLSDLEKRGVSINLAQLEGHGTMRLSLLGTDYSYPGEEGMKRMENFVDESLEAGAFGFSLGLGYEPGMFVDNLELERLAARVKERDAVLAVHLKALSKICPAFGVNPFSEEHNLIALKEMLNLAEKTGVRLQISHLIFVGEKTWPSCERALELIEQARDRGLDVAFDSYPQMAGNTTVHAVYPDWFLVDIEKNFDSFWARLRLNFEWSLGFFLVGFGLEDAQLLWGGHPDFEKYDSWFFTDIARDMKCSLRDCYMKITRVSKGKATVLFHKYSGDDERMEKLLKVLAHPLNLFMTDAIVSPKGAANPGAYGTFPRLIQLCHKEKGLLTLEDAIHRMTGKSAERFGLENRGVIKPGAWADITIFDLENIRDNTTPADTRKRPSGIKHVFMNGKQVVENGVADGRVKYGRVIRRS